MGIRFQHQPEADPCEIIIHVRLLDAENVREQEALSMLGVNLMPQDVLAKLQAGDATWESMLPDPAVRLIKERRFFCCQPEAVVDTASQP